MGTKTLQTPTSTGVFGAFGSAPVLEQGIGRWAAGAVTAPPAAPYQGAALPAAVRLRVPMTGLPIGAGCSDHGTTQLNSDTPGDPPPRDPPSR